MYKFMYILRMFALRSLPPPKIGTIITRKIIPKIKAQIIGIVDHD